MRISRFGMSSFAFAGMSSFAFAAVALVLAVALDAGRAMAQAAPAAFGKPVAPFTLSAEAVAPPALGVPVDVRIAVETQTELEDIEVRISADDGLSVNASDYTLYAPSATPEQPAEWLIRVVPTAEGEHRLLLFGEAFVGGMWQGSSAVATIEVGGEAPQSAADSTVTDAGAKSGARGDSAVRAAGSAVPGERDSVPGEREAARPGAAAAAPGADSAEPGTERVIRLPATVRP